MGLGVLVTHALVRARDLALEEIGLLTGSCRARSTSAVAIPVLTSALVQQGYTRWEENRESEID